VDKSASTVNSFGRLIFDASKLLCNDSADWLDLGDSTASAGNALLDPSTGKLALIF
jgi:hypothetical protein